MDISELYTADAHNDGAEMRVKSPLSGELTECYITVSGLDSKAFRSAEMKGKRKVLAAYRDAVAEDNHENLEREVIAETLADATIGWRGFTSNGKELKFSRKSIYELYLNSPNISDQVDTFIANRKNFIKG